MKTQKWPKFVHHGAADGVTGSCHRYIASDQLHLLIDCGLFQGMEASANGNIDHAIEFDLSCVAALVVTHVHIDHIGRLPYLFAAGFTGPILCSIPSARLLPLVIEDALKIGFTRDRRLIENFLMKVNDQLMPLNYRQWYVLLKQDLLQLRVRLQRAGHILGSAYVELELKTRENANAAWHSHVTVFSGDLGAPYAPLLPAPKSPYRADTLIIESTYGNRLHENRRERRLKLKVLVEKAMKDGGTVLIPAFSIGRTQELLYEFESILHEVRKTSSYTSEAASSSGVWDEIAIVVDSPLAAKFTDVYKALKPFWDKEALQRLRAGRHPLDFESLITVFSHEDHARLVRHLAVSKRPAIVLAASGMAAGGRIVNYLKAMIADPVHCVLFVGYQAQGTPGHNILFRASAGRNHSKSTSNAETKQAFTLTRPSQAEHEEPWVEFDGERYPIRARVVAIGGYSAHADQANLLSFVRNMRFWPQQIRVVHGNDEARRCLREKLLEMAQARGAEMEVLLPQRA